MSGAPTSWSVTRSGAPTSARGGSCSLKKLQAALRDGLVPILCVGENLEERESGRTRAGPRRAARGDLLPAGRRGVVRDRRSPTSRSGRSAPGERPRRSRPRRPTATSGPGPGALGAGAAEAVPDPLRRERHGGERGRPDGAVRGSTVCSSAGRASRRPEFLAIARGGRVRGLDDGRPRPGSFKLCPFDERRVSMLYAIMLILHILVAILLMAVVLMQSGRGGGLGASVRRRRRQSDPLRRSGRDELSRRRRPGSSAAASWSPA